MTTKLQETTKKTLSKQTSEQLFSKLKGGKLFGSSQEIALEILKERKEKGKFDGDLSEFEGKGAGGGAKESAKKADKTEKKAEAGKEAATKRVSKLAEQFPDWEPRFKKGQKVKFTPFRENKELTGEILSSYPYKPKKGELREDVRIKVGEDIYVKNGNDVKLVK